MTPARRARPSAFSVVLTLFAGLLVYLGAQDAGTVLRAAFAEGEAGRFVPVELSCVEHPGHESCVWTGDFRASDGMVLRRGVELYGSDRATQQAGRSVPAVDVGAPARVYSPGGSGEWMFRALLLGAAAAVLWFLYVRRPRRAPAASRS
ncbi:hypothetical protein GCM10009850_078100 [Nonomuraea monospora]|uniref:DUF3592 domain-containing protein n=1 Tax=Nonomuraea monospora TaxID=568818 RepID=A0ABN3CSB3_9ACTN